MITTVNTQTQESKEHHLISVISIQCSILNLKEKDQSFQKLMTVEQNILKSMPVEFRFKNSKFLKTYQVVCKISLGLVPRTGPLPRTRRFWTRPTVSWERNGVFNIHTLNFNTRFLVPFLFGFLIYGWWGHSTYGLYKQRYEDNG